MKCNRAHAIALAGALVWTSPLVHAGGCSAGSGHFSFFQEQPESASTIADPLALAIADPGVDSARVDSIVAGTLQVINEKVASLPGLQVRMAPGTVERIGDEVQIGIDVEIDASTCEARQGAGCSVFLQRYVRVPLDSTLSLDNGRSLAVMVAGSVSRLIVEDVSRELEQRGFSGAGRLRQRAARLARLGEGDFPNVL